MVLSKRYTQRKRNFYMFQPYSPLRFFYLNYHTLTYACDDLKERRKKINVEKHKYTLVKYEPFIFRARPLYAYLASNPRDE